MNARLPEDLEAPAVRNMEVGEKSWSVPWAMEVDSERRCWLRSTYTGHDEPGGTVSMLVTRTEDGFEVDLSQVDDYAWEIQYAVSAEEIDGQDSENPEWLPVVRIIR